MNGPDWERVVDADTEAVLAHGEHIGGFFHKPLSELEPDVLLTGSREDEFCLGDFFEKLFAGMLAEIGHGGKHIFARGGHPAMLSNQEGFISVSDVFFRRPMDIQKVTGDKKEYLDLLLLADEQEDMVDRYLERGEMFVLRDGGVKGECVVTRESDGVYELKNIAVYPDCQRRGYGKRLADFAFSRYPDCKITYVGTGDCPSSLAFYRACGFAESHRVKNFFTDNYDHPMFEDGVQLVDMVYLKRVRE